MNARTGHLDKQKELAHLNPKLRRAILGGVTFCSLVLALMCITQPFNPLSQFIFLMLLWGVALLVRRIPGRFSALMLIVLSLTGIVPLYLVALYLDAELERPGKPGVRDHSAVRRDLRLGGAGAGLLPGGLAAESPAGAAAGGHGFVANRGHLRPHL
ncbi:cellulose synthase catalytic subunit [Klebsiella pneumoniae]|uniref:Cellulose synthase catalytic subunit n=1 Tax=Klebsiella pneumoniae TaxID=573 RepID=A0A377UPT5_KLEPN|nr:cellulose synthase catalytic subunit [Klebsiella pneumoniae]